MGKDEVLGWMIPSCGLSASRSGLSVCEAMKSHIEQPGFEMSLVMQIARRTIQGHGSLGIASAFARTGIPGHIFVEGNLPDVIRVVQGLVTVITYTDPVLIPLAHRDVLLRPRNPISRPIQEGNWVRCTHGLYRNDIGFVCDRDPSRDEDTIVAFVPRIPEKASWLGKRKRSGRPEPRRWTATQVEAAWGPKKVRRVSAEEYEFRGERYISGLIMKQIPSASLVNVQDSPSDISHFISATCIRNKPSFAPWVHRFAQDTIRPTYRVKVESGDHRGAIGQVFDINGSLATVILDTTGNGPMLVLPLRSLSPYYSDGDNVKSRWSDSCGMLLSVDEDHSMLTYVETDFKQTVS
jgi:transcription elongation factor SPT5